MMSFVETLDKDFSAYGYVEKRGAFQTTERIKEGDVSDYGKNKREGRLL